jgi:hypothetical protein
MPHRPPEYWRKQAKEARRLAAIISLASDQRTLLGMAEKYDRLAKAAEERQASKSHQK